MFKKRNLIFICLLILGVFLISGCFLIATSTYTVTYDGNGSTGGSVPIDSTVYKENDTVTVLDKGDLVNTGYAFAGWNTQADGSGTDQAVGSTFTMGTSDVTLYAKWTPPGTYSLRDIGPAGGWIFYDDEADGVDDIVGARYLEAAPVSTEWKDKQWGSYGTLIGGTEMGIGTGQSNTTTIVTWLNSHPETDKAAQLCDALVYGGYSDWFLPSKDELNLMYENLHDIVIPVGGFADYYYWSSSEGSAYGAWVQGFSNGSQVNYGKDGTFRVRAVRAF